jgi:hypothetical protein
MSRAAPGAASANLNELYVTIAKNRLYAQQGRAATNGGPGAQVVRPRCRDLAVLQHAARRWQVEPHDGPDAHRLHVLAGATPQRDAARRRDSGAGAGGDGDCIRGTAVRRLHTSEPLRRSVQSWADTVRVPGTGSATVGSRDASKWTRREGTTVDHLDRLGSGA